MSAPRRTPNTHAVLWAIVLVVACVSLVAVGVTERAMACSCSYPTDVEAFEQSDAVFVGTLVEVQTPPGDVIVSSDLERFIFDVDAVYKGAVTSRQAVATAREGASCGLEIGGPGPFLVFARASTPDVTPELDDNELHSTLCSGTRPSSETSVPAAFGPPAPPIDDTNDSSPTDTGRVAPSVEASQDNAASATRAADSDRSGSRVALVAAAVVASLVGLGAGIALAISHRAHSRAAGNG